jgi:hypothetical protein
MTGADGEVERFQRMGVRLQARTAAVSARQAAIIIARPPSDDAPWAEPSDHMEIAPQPAEVEPAQPYRGPPVAPRPRTRAAATAPS